MFLTAHFPGKARLVNLLGSHSGVRTCTRFGCTFHLDLSEHIQRNIYYGSFEPQETALIRGYLRDGMTFVDVGANVGYYTAMASQVAGRVIAFEPSPLAFRKLRQMIDENGIPATALNVGLSDSEGSLRLYMGHDVHNHTPSMVPQEGSESISVPVKTLDACMDELGVEVIDLIKIDVEGHETSILKGAKNLLSQKRIRAMLCEFNEHWLTRSSSSSAELESIILSNGFVEVARVGGNGLSNRLFALPVIE